MPKQSLQYLEVILKTAERCNIDCTYCYFFHGGDDSYREHPANISAEAVGQTAEFIRQGVLDLGIEKVHIDFHGGEPLMQKKQHFDQMCRKFRQEIDDHTELGLNLQTNAMLVDEEWIELFAEHQVSVGVSLDGPKDYNDRYRVDRRGRGSYDRAVRGIEKLRAAEEAGQIPPIGALCVIQPENDGRRIYRHFVDDLGLKYLDFLIPDMNYESRDLPDPKAIGHYLCEVFDEWTRDDDPEVYIRFFRAFFAILGGQSSFLFHHRDKPFQVQAVTVSSNGELGPDDTLRSTGFWPHREPATVRDTTLRAFLDLPTSRGLQAASNRPPETCRECCWERVCGAGQMVNRYSDANQFDNPSVFCEGLKAFYKQAIEYLLENGVEFERIQKALIGEEPEREVA